MNPTVKEYYDNLATEYDDDRFGNTYGQYIDRQEKVILQKLLSTSNDEKILDMGCGTGRFLEFANYGIDISPNMIEQSKLKFPNKTLAVNSATSTDFEAEYFDKIFSFHVLMHLDKTTTNAVLDEAHRILKKEGTLIIDVPSKKRRNFTNYKADNWHGANDYTIEELNNICSNKWKIEKHFGIAYFPIHRIPNSLRTPLIKIDNLLCRSIFKEYASYLIVVLKKL